MTASSRGDEVAKTAATVPTASSSGVGRGARPWLLGVLAALGLVIAASLYSEHLRKSEQAPELAGRTAPPAGTFRSSASSVPDASAPDAPAPDAPATVEAIVEESQHVVHRLAAEFPNDPEALHQIGLAWVYLGQSAKAIEYWKKCIEIHPEYPHVYRDLAIVARKKGNLDEAVLLLRKAMAVDPRAFASQFDLGDALLAAGQTEEATAILRRLVQMYPRSVEGYVLLGAACLQRNHLKEARQFYETAIKLDPMDELACSGLATTCARLGD